MVRSLLLSVALCLVSAAVLAQSATLQGKVTDGNEALIGATVKVLKGTDFVRGTQTDYEGNYRIQIDPGTYNVEVSYTGFSTSRTENFQVLTSQINFLDVTMSNTVLAQVVITEYKVPLIKQDQTSGGQTLTAETIRNLPTRSVNAIVATTAGTTSIDGGEVNIKGSRANATNYYIDGIRVSGSVPPVQDIEQLQVVTGGLGAEYGDVTGGVVSVVTKGPASEYHGAIDVENSNYLDPYGWFLGNANLSGPLLKRTKADGSKETMLGFRLSGQFWSQKDDDPPAVPVYRVKNSVLKNMEANPLVTRQGNIIPYAETFTQDSVEALDYRPNENRRDIDVTSKLDFRITDAIDFSVTGTFKDAQDRFTPDGWSLLNSHNNPTNYSRRVRGLGRLRHRLGGGTPDNSSNRVYISNASYQLQFGFERANTSTYDKHHKDRLFDYGYIGTADVVQTPVIGELPDTNIVGHIDYFTIFQGASPGYVDANGKTVIPNPVLTNYNNIGNTEDLLSFIVTNGQQSDVYTGIWSNMFTNVGQVYNSYAKTETDIITILASSNFDLKLGKSGVHNIQFGIMNEQRTIRSYNLAPFGLYQLATQNVNNHFNGLDTNTIVDYQFFAPTGDTVPIYANAVTDIQDYKFYRSIRTALNVPIYEFVNVNGLRPDQLQLSMFSPRELTDNRLVSYYGYDYTGNKVDNVSFNDFFQSIDDQGVRNLPVAPLQPLYQAAYIKDKFSFSKMIFSLGLRVERFDLNTRVMRDPYSLYAMKTAGDYYRENPDRQRPGTIGDDYKVYISGQDDITPKAYRNGDTWYTREGVQADPNFIFGGSVIRPYLQDTITGDNVFDTNFNPDLSFEDYTPQVNWLPRLAFSFPISEDANFFAHYDVLVQRPQDNWQVTPLNYLYFYVPNRTTGNNANLRPERVVDYEVGFQQRLNQNSALKFSAYYREMRDMIQQRVIGFVPVIGQYTTVGNIDFGTVKGFTLQYDLRRIQNAELRLAYTLQFADGTGSNSQSQAGLANRGNLRTLYPLDFDERHNIAAIFDYRFGQGKQYNGPQIGGVDIFSLLGLNVQMNAASGRPYTARQRPRRFDAEGIKGSINGNRLPWRFNLDARLDKSFNLTAADKKPLNLNVYLRVSNLLNRKNIIGVYTATGSPADDGYLASGEGQTLVNSLPVNGARNRESYLSAYSWGIINNGFYTQPRRIYIGATFEF